MPAADRFQRRVRKEAVSAFGKRRPRHEARAVRSHQFPHALLLREDVCLELHHGGLYVGMFANVDVAAVVEVAQTNRAHLAVRVSAFHGAPRSEDISERLMNEEQIDVVRPELFERRINARGRSCFARVRDPDLRHEEELSSCRQAALPTYRPSTATGS